MVKTPKETNIVVVNKDSTMSRNELFYLQKDTTIKDKAHLDDKLIVSRATEKQIKTTSLSTAIEQVRKNLVKSALQDVVDGQQTSNISTPKSQEKSDRGR